MHYALYMIFLTFDLSTPVKYERIGVYESVEKCEEMRNAMASDIWSDENNPAFARNEWVEMEPQGLVTYQTFVPQFRLFH